MSKMKFGLINTVNIVKPSVVFTGNISFGGKKPFWEKVPFISIISSIDVFGVEAR